MYYKCWKQSKKFNRRRDFKVFRPPDIFDKDSQEDEENFGAMFFYKKYEDKYPQLTNLARTLLSVTTTSVPSECLFSHVKLTLTEIRNRLNSALLEQLTVIKDNLIQAWKYTLTCQ